MTTNDQARLARAAKRATEIVLRKARLGEPELDFSPVRGAEGVSLATRLTVESFGLAGIASDNVPRAELQIRFVPRSCE